MIEFTKMNGNGNNFLVLENFKRAYTNEELRNLAIQACNTKFSIGADGILVIEESEIAEFKMRLFNSNGTEGEMCGNGARCIAKYAFYSGMASEKMRFETLAGIVEGQILGNEVMISMGRVDLSSLTLENTIAYGDGIIQYAYLVVGVPHVVIISEKNCVESLEEMKRIGRYLDGNHEVFPEGTNVNFVQTLYDNMIQNTTYERGVEDITESCGTGSCASAVVASMLWGMKSPVLVKNLGGDNKVWMKFDSDQKYCDIQLAGAANFSAQIKMLDI